jgi:regulator of protease activity HflC (stomatin/prohibitin superfamily)
MHEVQVTVQTDAVTGIPCGTSGGVLIHFDKVEVVNRLSKDMVYETIKNYTIHYDTTWIFDKIHHEINQFCSSHTLQEVYIDLFDTLDESLGKAIQESCDVWAPGIEIIAVRVTKPRIPEQIRRNYEQMEAEKTKLLIATQTQKVVQKEAETERKRATIEAQMLADVSKIKMEKQIAVNRAEQEIQTILDKVHINKERARSDAQYYAAMKEADANSKLLTGNYLEYIRIQSLSNNTKIYFGDKIPEMYVNNAQKNS